VETNLESAKIKFDMGMLSQTDLLQFQSDMAAKETEMILQRAQFQTAIQDLKNTLNFSGNITLQAISFEEDYISKTKEIPTEKVASIIEKCIQVGKTQNHTLQTLENTRKIASANVMLAAGNSLPTIQLSLRKNWVKSWDENMKAADVGFTDSQEIGISASIPIFPIADNYADYSSAKFQKRKTTKELESTEKNIELAIESAVLNFISFAKSIEQAKLSLDYATELYAQMEERFESGMISGTELLDAEVILKNAKFSHTKAIYSYKKAKSLLMKLLSLEDKNDLYELLF
jgi:outer membrane protein